MAENYLKTVTTSLNYRDPDFGNFTISQLQASYSSYTDVASLAETAMFLSNAAV